jgi:hypothetical protein
VERAFSHVKVILAKTKHHMLNDLLGALLFLRTNERDLEMTTLMAFGEVLEGMACAKDNATIQDEDQGNLGQSEPREETHPAAVPHWGADAPDLRIGGRLPGDTQ